MDEDEEAEEARPSAKCRTGVRVEAESAPEVTQDHPRHLPPPGSTMSLRRTSEVRQPSPAVAVEAVEAGELAVAVAQADRANRQPGTRTVMVTVRHPSLRPSPLRLHPGSRFNLTLCLSLHRNRT